MRFDNQKSVIGILTGLLAVNIFAWAIVCYLSQSPSLEVNFFDVGQGDAIFIETAQGQQILIDGGPGNVILEKLAKELPFWDRTIDLIILTHPELDHLSGLIEVLKNYQVENILWTGVVRETAVYQEWEKAIKAEGAKIFIARAGQKIISGKSILEILCPFDEIEEEIFKDSNNTSIVAKLVFGNTSFLFTGDIGKSQEKEIISRGEDIDSDVLKVPHHGSKTSSSEEFIRGVSPEIAIISVGKDNKYGHPHQEVLDILNKYGINVLRTDRDGDIKIFSDGDQLLIR